MYLTSLGEHVDRSRGRKETGDKRKPPNKKSSKLIYKKRRARRSAPTTAMKISPTDTVC